MSWKPSPVILLIFSTIISITMLVYVAGCETEKVVYVDRSGCLSCHRPLQPNGRAHGIEKAHPLVNGRELTCERCHGGNPKSRKQSEAHVSPGRNSFTYIRNLTIGELDNLKPEYLRFINPGDYRVADQSCGTSKCHQSIIDKVKTNPMATFSGELGVARYRAGIQNSGGSVKAIYDVRDLSFVFGKIFGTVGALSKMMEPRIPKGENHIGPYQDLYLTKACMRCHTWSFGDNKFPGDFRSSGCTSCHMNYKNDGLSRSKDPHIDKSTPPHPAQHILTNKITTEQCMHCHYRGGRIGPSFNGYREGAGTGLNPPRAGFVSEALHGHDASYYINDEDTSNKVDETPPDVHMKAGMSCIDCHGKHDLHGDGHLYSATAAVAIRCESCHGSATKESTLKNAKGQTLNNLSKDSKGDVWLTTKITGKKLRISQIKRAIDQATSQSYLHRLMGRDKNGFSHMDKIACSTCHSGWIPNCYGCHVSVDMRGVQRSLISGQSTPGSVSGGRKWVTVSDMILMINTKGQISLSMPAERMFFNAIDGTGKKVINKQVRRGPKGEIGHGHRAFSPHTIQKWSPFMRCNRCHPASDGSNKQKIDLAVGFGTDRFIETDGNGKKWRLDQLQDRNFKSMVLLGHKGATKSSPLPRSIVERMMKFKITPPACVDKKTPVTFSHISKMIFAKSCVSCHNTKDPQGNLDLSPGKAWDALINKTSSQAKGKKLVVPSKPDDSYLLLKVTGGAISGARMPTAGDYLWTCQVNMLKQWIQKGAKKD